MVPKQLPSELYQQYLDQGAIHFDAQQQQVLVYLDQLSIQLHRYNYNNIFKQLLNYLLKPIKPISKSVLGLYLWGGVGIGKTFMMDLFYQSLLFSQKQRQHFHQFMDEVHQALNQFKGQTNPLARLAKKIAKQYRVLCFDEFYVRDITDAMVFANLLPELFAGGICLVATSNCAPENLYLHGLQRQNFMPAIQLIQQHTHTFHLISQKDYRRHFLCQQGVYYTPLTTQAEQQLEQAFNLYLTTIIHYEPIIILDRLIAVRQRSENMVWFDFFAICGVPRSQRDYLVLVQQFDIILISNIPIIQANQHDLIISFIQLIDILYDANCKLIISAATIPEQLYPQGKMLALFQRTVSRLHEMQSSEYFNLPSKNSIDIKSTDTKPTKE